VIRAAVDANIWVSAFTHRPGKPHDLLQLAVAGKVNLTISKAIIAEVADVLGRKFRATPEELVIAENIMWDGARVVTPSVELQVIAEDPADDRILECAVSAGAEYLVTGDKDLLRLGRFDSIRILNVSDFLDLALARGQEP
jgi:putative PIN family toxin of toxin-antitoxin system